jgi:hypothetical protein
MGTGGSTLADAQNVLDITGNANIPVAYFKANGNTLIGTGVDNGNKLQVNGTANIMGTLNGPGTGSGSYAQTMLVSPAINARSDYESLAALRINPTFNTNGYAPWKYALLISNGDAQFANGLLLNAGDPYPSRIFSGQTIQIQSNAQTGPQISMNNWIGGAFTGPSVVEMGTGSSALNPSQNILAVYGNNGYVGTFFKADGKLGIGTNAPTTQFHTTGTVRFAGLTNDDTQMRVVVADADGNLYYRNLSTLSLSAVSNATAQVQQASVDAVSDQAALLKRVEALTSQLQVQQQALEKQNETINLLKQEVELLKKGKRNNH